MTVKAGVLLTVFPRRFCACGKHIDRIPWFERVASCRQPTPSRYPALTWLLGTPLVDCALAALYARL